MQTEHGDFSTSEQSEDSSFLIMPPLQFPKPSALARSVSAPVVSTAARCDNVTTVGQSKKRSVAWMDCTPGGRIATFFNEQNDFKDEQTSPTSAPCDNCKFSDVRMGTYLKKRKAEGLEDMDETAVK